MVYFPESTVITTLDGIQFKSFSNEHPPGFIIAKPKYIPTETIFCDKFLVRKIFGKEFNRLDLWVDQEELKYYLDAFKENYPHYFYYSRYHKNWFFAVPKKAIKQVYDPKEGLKEIMKLPKEKRDEHLDNVINFIALLLQSGVSLNDLGITFSTLVGYYDKDYSDINVVVYGKSNAWKILNFLENVNHPLLRWKTPQEWEDFRNKRNRKNIFTKKEFIDQMSRKRTEGFFNETLFVIFSVEKPNETWNKWGEEIYFPLGEVEITGIVTDDYNSIVRPGCYEIENSKVMDGFQDVPIKQVVFYSRDYVAQIKKGEKLKARGILEKVKNVNNGEFYRVVVGYFDSYISQRRNREYIKRIK